MAEPKGIVYRGVDNSGYATVLDKAQDPAAIMQPLINKFVDREWDKVKKAEQEKKLMAANIAKVNDLLPKWDKTKDIRSSQIENAVDVASRMAASGVDPFMNNDFRNTYRELQYQIEQDNLARQALAKYQQEYAKGLYDDEVYASFLNNVENASPEEVASLVLNENPLVKKTDFYEGLQSFEPNVFESVYESPSGVTTTKVELPEENATGAARAYIIARQGENPNFVETGIKKGLWDSAEGAERFYADVFKTRARESRKTTRESGGGGLSINMGAGQQSDKFTAAYSNDPTISTVPQGQFNNIQIGDVKTGSELRPLEFNDAAGNPVFAKVGSVQYADMGKLKKKEVAAARARISELEADAKVLSEEIISLGGKANEADQKRIANLRKKIADAKKTLTEVQNLPEGNRWVIVGTKAKRVTGEQAEKLKQEMGVSFDTEYKEQEDGTYISITENEPVYLPIDPNQGTEGHANFSKLTSVTGLDLTTPLMSVSGATQLAQPTQTTSPMLNASKYLQEKKKPSSLTMNATQRAIPSQVQTPNSQKPLASTQQTSQVTPQNKEAKQLEQNKQVIKIEDDKKFSKAIEQFPADQKKETIVKRSVELDKPIPTEKAKELKIDPIQSKGATIYGKTRSEVYANPMIPSSYVISKEDESRKSGDTPLRTYEEFLNEASKDIPEIYDYIDPEKCYKDGQEKRRSYTAKGIQYFIDRYDRKTGKIKITEYNDGTKYRVFPAMPEDEGNPNVFLGEDGKKYIKVYDETVTKEVSIDEYIETINNPKSYIGEEYKITGWPPFKKEWIVKQ